MADPDDLVVERREGLYCPPGDFYIDPWRPVDRAVITHAHADHARAGHRHVLASTPSAPVLRARLGAGLPLQTLDHGQVVEHHGVRISLHPAGHVLGSAQVRLEHRGRVWVVSGDYFLSAHDERNPTCPPFEPVRCHCFITESTFGLPVYRWQPQATVLDEVNAWWRANAAAGRPSLLLAYSFGKAQRLLAGIDPGIGPIAVHGAVAAVNAAYAAAGVALPPTLNLGDAGGPGAPDEGDAAGAAAVAAQAAAGSAVGAGVAPPSGDVAGPPPAAPPRRRRSRSGPVLPPGALVIAPPAVHASAWARRLGDFSDGFASGWMALRGARRRQGVDRGFALSDHADWPGLLRAIAATGAERVIVTHGFEAVLVRWLQEQGLRAESFTPAVAAAYAEGGGSGHPSDGAAEAVAGVPADPQPR